MHVAIAAHDLYPDPGSGGSGRYVYETGRRLADRGHRVSVLTRRRGDVPSRETVAGMDVYRYDLQIADRSAPSIARQLPRSLSRAAEHADAMIADGPPDVLSLQGPVTGPLLSALLDGTIPRSCTFHSSWPTEYRLRTRSAGRSRARRGVNARIRRTVERRSVADCDDVITLSAFVRDRLLRSYADVPEPVVIPGGVDLERYAPGAASIEHAPERDLGADGGGVAVGGTDATSDGANATTDAVAPAIDDADGLSGDPAFLTVRRLAERMGHGLLLEAFAAVRERNVDARLYLAGDGPLREHLERRTARLGLDDAVSFLGHVPDARLPATYAAADVFVLPTTELEGFGLATLEALASGTPVVATPVGATPEVIGGLPALDGFRGPAVVPSATAAELAVAMNEWATVSAGERTAAGRACRRYVERCYPWKRTVTGLERRYGRLTA